MQSEDKGNSGDFGRRDCLQLIFGFCDFVVSNVLEA